MSVIGLPEARQTNPVDVVEHLADLNDWAYRMLNGGGNQKNALEIFKLDVYLYPESANAYDSVAEAYAANGFKDRINLI